MIEQEGDEFVYSQMFNLMHPIKHAALEDALRAALRSKERHTVNLLSIYNMADPTNPDEMAYAGSLMGWYMVNAVR